MPDIPTKPSQSPVEHRQPIIGESPAERDDDAQGAAQNHFGDDQKTVGDAVEYDAPVLSRSGRAISYS
jgi:hypothetical protein